MFRRDREPDEATEKYRCAASPSFQDGLFLQGEGMNEVLTELITWWLETDEGEFPPENKGRHGRPDGKKG